MITFLCPLYLATIVPGSCGHEAPCDASLPSQFVDLTIGHKGTAGKNSDFVGLVLCDLVSVEKSTAGNVLADVSFADLSKGYLD